MGNAYKCGSQNSNRSQKYKCFVACSSKRTKSRSGSNGAQNQNTACEFCGQPIAIQGYAHHIKTCDKNPINVRTPCEFCQEKWPSDLLAKHVLYCPQNPENMKLICYKCKSQIRMKHYEAHLKKCQILFENCLQPEQECPICLCEMRSNDAVRFLPCLHKYHEKCIADWSKRTKNCPICRTTIP